MSTTTQPQAAAWGTECANAVPIDDPQCRDWYAASDADLYAAYNPDDPDVYVVYCQHCADYWQATDEALTRDVDGNYTCECPNGAGCAAAVPVRDTDEGPEMGGATLSADVDAGHPRVEAFCAAFRRRLGERVGERVMDLLGIDEHQLNALFAAGPVRGWTGDQVVAQIVRDHGIADEYDRAEDSGAWIDLLYQRGLLTALDLGYLAAE